MLESLKPLCACPFCGGEAELVNETAASTLIAPSRSRYPHYVQCTKCRVRTEGSAFQNDTYNIECWNRRVLEQSAMPTPSKERLDQLEAIGDWLAEAGKQGMADELLALHAALIAPNAAR